MAMEEILLSDTFHIKVKERGSALKVKNAADRDLLMAHFFHTNECGCCGPSDNPIRFQVCDMQSHGMWRVEGNMPDTCCGCEDSPVVGRVVGEGGAVLGIYEGRDGYYKVMTQSHDILFIAEDGVLSSTYKITSKLDGNAKGKITKEFSFGSVTSRLELPQGLSQQHRILLITVALEATTKYYERQQRS